MGRPTTM